MTPAEKLARALEDLLGAFHGFDDGKSPVIDKAREALAAWRSQQAGEVMRAPLPKVLAMLPGEIRAAIHAYAEDARQQGMDQERALWELAKSSQEIEAAPKPPPMPDNVRAAIVALQSAIAYHNRALQPLLDWLQAQGFTKE